MGREIRRVPKDWEHPRNDKGNYKPVYDRDYETSSDEWVKNCALWAAGNHPDQEDDEYDYPKYFWEWDNGPPDEEYHLPKFNSEPTHYQIYENVSEGTPTSPIFASLDEMKTWLIGEGYSEHAASMFCETGYAPSMVFTVGRGVSGIGIHSLDHLGN